MDDQSQDKVRLDKWLWAGRFFKTRALAKAAIEGGKVHIDGQRAKPSKEVTVGIQLVIRQGRDEKTVVIKKLSEQRRGASEAVHLYQETEDSIAQREKKAEERKAANLTRPSLDHRPSKKQRRQIHRFKEQNL
ncbi:ribosome-associated heat shock protein Hsp15 [Porticoccus litoralis]|uniref:Heat shock protein 15 n=1 Tax=Porticoccus litoralis TaxID=434086 RepID=A0AAW8B1B6_9GAMM|nr:ribosome-associated heat shock protein Hsp15 [Porticoccus litoralis]MDP1520350.1 ribosome-associated heat shock protein Hsp15 [Porticoccus litoralis]